MKCLKVIKSKDKTYRADNTREDSAGTGKLKEEPVYTKYHQYVCNIRVAEGIQYPQSQPHGKFLNSGTCCHNLYHPAVSRHFTSVNQFEKFIPVLCNNVYDFEIQCLFLCY